LRPVDVRELTITDLRNRLATAQHRADQAEARVAELTAALREVVQLCEEQSGATPPDESRYLDLDCENGHVATCPITQARAVLTRTPAAAAERVAAMAAVCEVLRVFVELRDHGPKGRSYVEALVDVTNRGRAALARLDALAAEK